MGSGGGRELQERADVCTLVADSHCGRAEANTTLKQLSSNFKNTIHLKKKNLKKKKLKDLFLIFLIYLFLIGG